MYCQPSSGVAVPPMGMGVEKIKLGMTVCVLWRVVSFGIQAQLVGVEEPKLWTRAMILAAVTIPTKGHDRTALAATDVHELDFFLIFTRRVNEIVRRASFSNPETLRMPRRNARGFATFIRRLRTQ